MPEIAEVARIVSFLKKHVVGRTISSVKVQDDQIVYGKVGTTAQEFQKEIAGKKVLDARQQGKYFWMVMESPPHPLMHFGMTGWMKFSNDDTSYYKPTKAEEEQWPPKFWKFILQTSEGNACAFVDARRLGRIRLVNVDADQMRKTTPLKENGPDPVIDREVLTEEWLAKKMRSKRVPIKALLLDQANISGVGNWVGDEVLYQARIHPEQYSNQFTDAEIKRLHDALIDVCTIAVSVLGDSSKFPDNWLMTHRWAKGKKEGGKLPNGDKIVFLTVGGRTSAVVPSVQKKTGDAAPYVAKGLSDPQDTGESDEPTPVKSKSKSKVAVKGIKAESPEAIKKRVSTKGQQRHKAIKKEEKEEKSEDDEPKKKKQRISKLETKSQVESSSTSRKGKVSSTAATNGGDNGGTRRSTRLRGA